MFGPKGLHGELEAGMLRHFLQGTLGYVGLTVVKPFAAFHVPYLDELARREVLASLAAHVDDFDALPLLEQPDLSRFDDRFAPREA